MRHPTNRGLEEVIQNYTVIIGELNTKLEKEHARSKQLKRKQEDFEVAIQAFETQVATITRQRNEERKAFLQEIERLRKEVSKKNADLQVANAKLFQTSLYERDAVEQRLARRMSSTQLLKLRQRPDASLGQEHNHLSPDGVPQLWMNAPKSSGKTKRPQSATPSQSQAGCPSLAHMKTSNSATNRPRSALGITHSPLGSKRDPPTQSSGASRGGPGWKSKKVTVDADADGELDASVESVLLSGNVDVDDEGEKEKKKEEERSVVICEWLLTMEGILAQTRGLKTRNLSLVVGSVVEMPRVKIWGTDPAMYLHTQPMTIKHHRRAVYDAIGKALRGQAEAPELLLSAVDSVSAHQRRRQIKEVGEMLSVLGSTLKVMDALLGSLLSPLPSATTIQHYAKALQHAFGCEAVKLFRVDADTQEVLSLLPQAPNSDGQSEHYSLSESGIVPFVVREQVLLNIPYPASSYAYFDGVRDAMPGAKHKLVDNMLCCPIYAAVEEEDAEKRDEGKGPQSALEGAKNERRKLFATPGKETRPEPVKEKGPHPMDKAMWEGAENELTFGKGGENSRCIAVLQLFNKKSRDFDLADEHLAFRAAGGLGPLIGRMQRKREESALLEGASCLTTATQEFAPERDLLGRAVSQLLRALKSVLRGSLVDLWLVRYETSTDRTYLSKLRDVVSSKDTEPGVRGERVYVYHDAPETYADVQNAPSVERESDTGNPKEVKGVGRSVIRNVAEKCKEWETPHEVAVPVVGQGGSCMGVVECSQRHMERADKNLEDDDSVSKCITAQDMQLLKMIGREIGRALESSAHFCLAVPPPPSQTSSSVVNVMQGVLRSIGTIARADRVLVFSVNRKGVGDLCLKPSEDLHPSQSAFSLDFGQGIPGAAAKHNRVVRVPMARLHRWYHSSYDSHFGVKTEAVVSCPIRAPCSGVILGALEVANKIEGGLAFTSVDEVFVRAASDQLGRLMVVEEASSRGLPVREVLEEQRRWQEENWAAEAMQRIFRAYKSDLAGSARSKSAESRADPQLAMLMRLARRMAILPPRKFQRPPTSLPQNLEAQLAMSVMSGELDSEASSAMLDRRASSLSLGRTSSMRQGPFTPKGSSSAGVPFAGLLASPFRRMNSDDSQRSSAAAGQGYLRSGVKRLNSGCGGSDVISRSCSENEVDVNQEDLQMKNWELQRTLAAMDEELSQLKQSVKQQIGRAKTSEEVKRLKGMLSDAHAKHKELEKRMGEKAADFDVQVQHNSTISLQLSRSRRQNELSQRQCQQLQVQIDLLEAAHAEAESGFNLNLGHQSPTSGRRSSHASPSGSPMGSPGRSLRHTSGAWTPASSPASSMRARRLSSSGLGPEAQPDSMRRRRDTLNVKLQSPVLAEATERDGEHGTENDEAYSPGFESPDSDGSHGSAKGFSHGRERSLNLFVATDEDDDHGTDSASRTLKIAPYGFGT